MRTAQDKVAKSFLFIQENEYYLFMYIFFMLEGISNKIFPECINEKEEFNCTNLAVWSFRFFSFFCYSDWNIFYASFLAGLVWRIWFRLAKEEKIVFVKEENSNRIVQKKSDMITLWETREKKP